MRRKIACLVAPLMLGLPASAQTLQEMTAATDKMLLLPGNVRACFPQFDGAADVHLLYTYGGGKPVDPQQTIHPVKWVDVTVRKTEKPVLIVGTSYEAIAWRFTIEPGARIAGVMLSGYYEQLVTGLPAGTPLGRTYYTNRSDQDAKPCGAIIDPETAASLEQQRDSLEEAVRETENQRQEVERALRYYNQFVALMHARGSDEATLAVSTSIISEKIAELEASKKLITKARQDLTAFDTARAKPAKQRQYSDRYFYVSSANKLKSFEKDIARVGPYTLVAYTQTNGKNALFEVSDKVAAEAKATRETSAQKLAALKAPDLKLMPADTPRGQAPDGVIAADGLNWLKQRGYIMQGGSLPTYACEYRSLQEMAVGMPRPRTCTSDPDTWTILGPIVFPPGLCGGHLANFVLPEGAPDPQGDSCHSTITRVRDLPKMLPSRYGED